MKLEDLKMKRIIVEIRYPPYLAVNRNIWDIAEKFKDDSSGFGITRTNGITVMKEKLNAELTAEVQRASYNAENISDTTRAIEDASTFLQYIIDHHSISSVDRLGSRFYYMLSEEKGLSREYYAKLISKTTRLLQNADFPAANTAGLVLRFSEDGRKIRFGIFSADEEVIKRYHRVHKRPEFLQPCILFDIDLYKEQVGTGFIEKKGFRPKKFSVREEIQRAYKHSLSFVRRYLTLTEENRNV